MALLELIGAGAGLLQGLNQNRQAQSQQRRALDLYADAARRARQEQERLTEVARQMQAGGFGDSAAQERLIDETLDDAEVRGQRNLLGAFRSLGYDAADTPTVLAGRRESDARRLQRLNLKQEARGQASQQRLALQGLYSPAGVNAADYAYGNALASSPLGQGQDLSGAISTLGSMDYGFLQSRRQRQADAAPPIRRIQSDFSRSIDAVDQAVRTDRRRKRAVYANDLGWRP